MLSLLRSWRMLILKLEERAHWQVLSRKSSVEHLALCWTLANTKRLIKGGAVPLVYRTGLAPFEPRELIAQLGAAVQAHSAG